MSQLGAQVKLVITTVLGFLLGGIFWGIQLVAVMLLIDVLMSLVLGTGPNSSVGTILMELPSWAGFSNLLSFISEFSAAVAVLLAFASSTSAVSMALLRHLIERYDGNVAAVMKLEVMAVNTYYRLSVTVPLILIRRWARSVGKVTGVNRRGAHSADDSEKPCSFSSVSSTDMNASNKNYFYSDSLV